MAVRLLVFVALGALCLAQDSPDGGQMRRQLGLGVQAYRQGHFEEAARYFEKAIEINPEAVNPHLYLGFAYAAQWNPNSKDADNLQFVHRAEAEYLKVLEVEPEQIQALQSIANLSYQRASALDDPADKWKQLTRAAGWYQHLVEVSPKQKNGFYMYGVIAWNKCQPVIDDARQKAGMQADTTGPIGDPALRKTVRETCESVIDDGIAELKKGLDANPDSDEAMSQLSILVRQRANLEDSAEVAHRDVKEADVWAQKAAEAKRRQASKPQDDSDQ